MELDRRFRLREERKTQLNVMISLANIVGFLMIIVAFFSLHLAQHPNPLPQGRAPSQESQQQEADEKNLFCPADEGQAEKTTQKGSAEQATNVNKTDKKGCTPLMRASESGNLQAVMDLLRDGANVNAKLGAGHTALMLAAKRGDLEVVKALLSAGADPNAKLMSFHFGDGTALMFALDSQTKNRFAILDAMIAGGAEVNPTGAFGRSPLTYAISKREKIMIKALIDRGADINLKNSNGTTPLMVAVLGSSAEMVKLLLAAGADVKARDLKGETALSIARREQKEFKNSFQDQIIQLLRKAARATRNRAEKNLFQIRPASRKFLHN